MNPLRPSELVRCASRARVTAWIGADNQQLGDGPEPDSRSQMALVAPQNSFSKGMHP